MNKVDRPSSDPEENCVDGAGDVSDWSGTTLNNSEETAAVVDVDDLIMMGAPEKFRVPTFSAYFSSPRNNCRRHINHPRPTPLCHSHIHFLEWKQPPPMFI